MTFKIRNTLTGAVNVRLNTCKEANHLTGICGFEMFAGPTAPHDDMTWPWEFYLLGSSEHLGTFTGHTSHPPGHRQRRYVLFCATFVKRETKRVRRKICDLVGWSWFSIHSLLIFEMRPLLLFFCVLPCYLLWVWWTGGAGEDGHGGGEAGGRRMTQTWTADRCVELAAAPRRWEGVRSSRWTVRERRHHELCFLVKVKAKFLSVHCPTKRMIIRQLLICWRK